MLRRDQRRRLEIVFSTALVGGVSGGGLALFVLLPLSLIWPTAPAHLPFGPLAGLVAGLIWGLRIR